MSLLDFQRAMTINAFANASNTDTPPVTQLKEYDSHELKERLAIYRNNTLHSLREAVKDLYPSVLATIGEDLMKAAAHHYIQQHPPNSAAMVDFAHDFPEFLASFEHTHAMGYLPDLATLDLAQHRSYHAQDQDPLTAEAFSALGLDTLANSRIAAHPSAQLIESNYAIYDMWQMAQGQRHDRLNADNPQHILVIRPQANVEVYCIDQGHFIFLSALKNRASIAEALETAQATTHGSAKHFEPANAIAFLIQSGFTAQLLGEQT